MRKSASPANNALFYIPSIKEYFMDLDYVLGVIADGPMKSFAYRRLKYLVSKFTMYTLLNEFQEMTDMKVCPSPHICAKVINQLCRVYLIGWSTEDDHDQSVSDVLFSDFYNLRKVDTHVHHSSSMNQKHLLRFIKAKMKKSPNVIHGTPWRINMLTAYL